MNRRSRFVMQRSLPVSEEEEPGGERYEIIETHQRNRTVDVRLGEESPEFLLPGFG